MRWTTWVLTVALIAGAGSAAPRGGATRPGRPYTPTTVPVEPGKPYVHGPSGVTFPANVGAFRRVIVYQMDDAGANVTAGYSDPTLKAIATIFVYSAEGLPIAKHSQTVKQGLLRTHRGVKPTKDGAWTLRQGEREFQGYQAGCQYIGRLGGVEQDLTTDLYLLPLPAGGGRGEHFIEFRVTYPTADAKAVGLRVEGLTEWLTLPEPPEPAALPATTRAAELPHEARTPPATVPSG